MQQWMTDTELCNILGDWWVEDMELHDGATPKQNVQSACAKLQEMHSTLRVIACRQHSSGDMLEWLVA